MIKDWYKSKTLWVNVLALAGVIAEGVTGKQVLTPEVQGVILTVVNLALRSVTKTGLTLGGANNGVSDNSKPNS